jgi:uncharacterized repeat protein (TIGR01451 family)
VVATSETQISGFGAGGGPPGGGGASTPLSGAIWTTNADGSTVDQNIYPSKEDVYLNGGPRNCVQKGNLPDGEYYFQVTDPSGKVLLSTDDIEERRVSVVGGQIFAILGTHQLGTSECSGAISVQLMPYLDTPNPGGEYKTWMTPVEHYDSNDPLANFGFGESDSKTDNFKVREEDGNGNGGGEPILRVTKTASSSFVTVSQPFTYTITAENIGTGTANNVLLVDDEDPELVFISANPPATVSGNVRPDGFTLTWSGFSLLAGQSLSFVVTKMPSLLAGDGDQLMDTATVSSPDDGTDQDTETVTVINPPGENDPRTPGFWKQQACGTQAAKFTLQEVQDFLNLISLSTTVSAVRGLTPADACAILDTPESSDDIRAKLIKFLLNNWLNLAANFLEPTQFFTVGGFSGTDADAKREAEQDLNANTVADFEQDKDVLDFIANS